METFVLTDRLSANAEQYVMEYRPKGSDEIAFFEIVCVSCLETLDGSDWEYDPTPEEIAFHARGACAP